MPRTELEWLAASGVLRTYEEGAVLTRAGGAPPDGLFIVLSGHIVISIDRGSGPQKAMEWRGGDVTGMLPYSRMTTPPGDTVVVERTVVLAIESARLLEDRLDDAERATLALGAVRLTEQQLTAIETVRTSCLASRLQGVLSPIQQAEREDAISDWLARAVSPVRCTAPPKD